MEKELLKINKRYFNFPEEKLPVIKYMKQRKKKKQNSIIWAYFHLPKNEIKINTIFKEKEVNKRFLSFIIYHELLHFEDDIINKKVYKNGIFHDSDFKNREKKFYGFKSMKKYEDSLFEKIQQGLV